MEEYISMGVIAKIRFTNVNNLIKLTSDKIGKLIRRLN